MSVSKMHTRNPPKFLHLFFTGLIFSLASVNPSSQQLTTLDLNKQLQIFDKCSIQVVLNTINSKNIPSENYNLAPLYVPATKAIFTYIKNPKPVARKNDLYCDNDLYTPAGHTGRLQTQKLGRTKCFALVYIDPKPCSTWAHREIYFNQLHKLFPAGSPRRRGYGPLNSVTEGQYFIHVIKGGSGESENSGSTSFWFDISFLMGFYLRSSMTTFPTSIVFEVEETNGNQEQLAGKTSVYDRNIFGSNAVGESMQVRDHLGYPPKHPYEIRRHTLTDLDKLSYSKFSEIHWIVYTASKEESDNSGYRIAAKLIHALSLNSTLHRGSYVDMEGLPTLREKRGLKSQRFSAGPPLLGEDEMKAVRFLTCASIHVEGEMEWSIFLTAFDPDIWIGILSFGIVSGILLHLIDTVRRRMVRIVRNCRKRMRMSRIRRLIEQMEVAGEDSATNLQEREEFRKGRGESIDETGEEIKVMQDSKISDGENMFVEGNSVSGKRRSSASGSSSSGISLGSGGGSDGKNRGSGKSGIDIITEVVEFVDEDRSADDSAAKDGGNSTDSKRPEELVDTLQFPDDKVDQIENPDTIKPPISDDILKEAAFDISVTGGIDVYYPQRRQVKIFNSNMPQMRKPRRFPGISLGATIGNLAFVYTFLLAQRTKLVHTSKFLCGSWALGGIILTYSYKQIIAKEMRQSVHSYRSYNWLDQLVTDNFTIYSPFSAPRSVAQEDHIYQGLVTKLGEAVDAKMRSAHWYRRIGPQIVDRIYRPDSHEEVRSFLRNPRGFVSNTISKCGHTVFADSYDNLVEFQVGLYRDYGILARIGYESFPSEEVTDWQFENVPWPSNIFSWKLKALQESGLVKLWKDWKERRYVGLAKMMSDLMDVSRRQSDVHPVSFKDRILIVFYLYLWMIVGCGLAWGMEHVWRVVVWLGRKWWRKYGSNWRIWERFHFYPKIYY